MSSEEPELELDDQTDRRPSSVEDLLVSQRDVLARLLRSDALKTGNVAEALRQVTEAAARLLAVRRASVWRFDDTRQRIECLDLHDSMTGGHGGGTVLERGTAPAYFEAALEERCIAAHDARTDARTREFTEGYLVPNGITSMLDAPVLVRGELVGVVCHEHVGPARRWQKHEELTAGTLADFVGMALTAAEHAVQATELARLHGNLEILVAERTRELEVSQRNVRALFETSPVALLLARLSDGRVILANDRALSLFELPAELMRDRSTAELFARPEEIATVRERARASGQVEGVEVELATSSGRRFWGSISAALLAFEGQQAILVGIHDITQLRNLASLDGLTGIFNRRHFFEVAESMIALADRQGRTLCLAMFDLDRFKGVNDTYGHAAGDEALRTLVAVCREECRATDVLARYGGEEFVLLLPDAVTDEAVAVVDRIRVALVGRTISHAGQSLSVTVSAGVAEREPGEELESLVRRADAALYAAKGAGRDRVERA